MIYYYDTIYIYFFYVDKKYKSKIFTSLSRLLAISVNLKQRSTPTLNTWGLVDKYFPVPQPKI